MKKILSVLLVALCLCNCMTIFPKEAKAQEKTTTIRVATYNIASKNQPDVSDFVDQFKQYDIDLAGVQEVDMNNSRNNYDMMQAFVCEEYPYTDFGKGRDYGGGDFGVGIVSRYAFINTQNIPLEGQGEATKAIERVEVEIDGKRVAIYNTHPSWESQELRRRQFRTLIEYVQADPTPYKIITGDFNADQSLYEFTMFLDDFYIANGKDGQWFDTYNANDDPNMKVNTIDNIIVSKNINIKFVDMVENTLSDHNMLYADLELLEDTPTESSGNIALGQAVTVDGDHSNDPLKMVDYDNATSYALADGKSAILAMDKNYTLDAIELQWSQPGVCYTIEYSMDQVEWKLLSSGQSNALIERKEVAGITARYLRLTAQNQQTIAEWRVIGKPAQQEIGTSSVIANGSFEYSEEAPTEQLGPSGTYWDVDLWENDEKPQNWNLQIYDAKGVPSLYQGSFDKEDKMDGNQSIVISKTDTSDHQAFFKQMYQPALADTTYQLSFWIKSDDLDVDELQLSISQRDESQKDISNTNIVLTDILDKQGEWIHYTKEIKTHSDTAYMDFVFKIVNQASGSFHLDAISMTTVQPAASIKVSGNAEMTIDEQQTLHYDILPVDADPQDYQWTSSDPDVLEVDEDGVVTAKQAGSAYVQVKAVNNSRLYASMRIDVHADKTQLETLIHTVSDLKQNNCSSVIWAMFEKTYQDALKVMQDPSADETEIQQAYQALEQAYQNVLLSSAKEDLRLVMEEAEQLKETAYEKESWEAFLATYQNAKAVYAQTGMTVESYRDAQTHLQEAMDQLVKIEQNVPGEEDNDEQAPSQPEEDKPSNEGNNEIMTHPDTAAQTTVMNWILLSFVAIGAMTYMIRKYHRDRS